MERKIGTERLLLRPLVPEDARDVFEWTGDPAVNRFLPYPLYTREEDVRDWIRSLTPGQYEFGFVRKDTGKVIGSGSVSYDEDLGAYVLGYNLNRAFRGNGYATEAARAMISWVRSELGATELSATVAEADPASARVIRKCGLTFACRTEYTKSDGIETFPAIRYTAHFDPDAGAGGAMRIALASDHGGFRLKERIRRHLEDRGFVCSDFGCWGRPPAIIPISGGRPPSCRARGMREGDRRLHDGARDLHGREQGTRDPLRTVYEHLSRKNDEAPQRREYARPRSGRCRGKPRDRDRRHIPGHALFRGGEAYQADRQDRTGEG